MQLIGKPVDFSDIQRCSVIIEEIERDLPVMPQQAFFDKRIITAPATGHEDAVIGPGFPIMQNASHDLAHSAEGVGSTMSDDRLRTAGMSGVGSQGWRLAAIL